MPTEATEKLKRSQARLSLIVVMLMACMFMLGLLIGFLLGGDSEKLKPVAEWDGPVGVEMRAATALQRTNDITEQLIAELRKCYPEAK